MIYASPLSSKINTEILHAPWPVEENNDAIKSAHDRNLLC